MTQQALASVWKVLMGIDVRSVFLAHVYPIHVSMVAHAKEKATVLLLVYVLRATWEKPVSWWTSVQVLLVKMVAPAPILKVHMSVPVHVATRANGVQRRLVLAMIIHARMELVADQRKMLPMGKSFVCVMQDSLGSFANHLSTNVDIAECT